MATKKKIVDAPPAVHPVSEGILKAKIERMNEIGNEIDALNLEWDKQASFVLATLKVKDVRQYNQLKCIVQQNMNRGLNWKKEATALARKLYPAAADLRKYVVALARRYPRKPGKPYVKLYKIKEVTDATSEV